MAGKKRRRVRGGSCREDSGGRATTLATAKGRPQGKERKEDGLLSICFLFRIFHLIEVKLNWEEPQRKGHCKERRPAEEHRKRGKGHRPQRKGGRRDHPQGRRRDNGERETTGIRRKRSSISLSCFIIFEFYYIISNAIQFSSFVARRNCGRVRGGPCREDSGGRATNEEGCITPKGRRPATRNGESTRGEVKEEGHQRGEEHRPTQTGSIFAFLHPPPIPCGWSPVSTDGLSFAFSFLPSREEGPPTKDMEATQMGGARSSSSGRKAQPVQKKRGETIGMCSMYHLLALTQGEPLCLKLGKPHAPRRARNNLAIDSLFKIREQ